jgi:hypothetical protein
MHGVNIKRISQTKPRVFPNCARLIESRSFEGVIGAIEEGHVTDVGDWDGTWDGKEAFRRTTTSPHIAAS